MAIKWRITDEQRRPQLRAKNFLARMERIPVKVKRRINAANEKSAEQLAAMMVRLVPTDDHDLQRSITYYELTGYRGDGGGIVWRVVAGDDTAFYARMVEHGTPNRAATPFFYPTYRSLRRLIKSRQRAAFRQGIKDSDT